MFDYDVLSIFSTRSNFVKYGKYVKDHALQEETVTIVKVISDYYKDNPTVDKIDWNNLSSYYWATRMASTSPRAAPVIKNVFSKMIAGYVPSDSADDVLSNLVEKDYAARTIQEAENVIKGTSSLEKVDSIVKAGMRDVGRFLDSSSLFVAPSIVSVTSALATTGYNWRLPCLNKSLGPLRTGDFIVVGAPVEAGKTTFIASETTFIAEQMRLSGEKRPIIWVNNEERSDKVYFRLHQAALGETVANINADPSKAEAEFDKIVGQKRILVTDGMVNDVKSLDSLFIEFNPCMIIFDTLDKVHGFSYIENEPMRLGMTYKWARDLAKQYGPVISVTQISADFQNIDPRNVSYTILRGSKVDKPGEADVILIIMPDPTISEDHRFINIPKNKMLGPLDESLRHTTHPVRIEPTIARYSE